MNPQFYNDPIPEGYSDRQTLYLSFGPTLGYQFSPSWSGSISAHFDVEHRAPDSEGLLHLGSALPDHLQTGLNYSTQFTPLFLAVGGYIQTLIWNPSLNTSIVGANASVSF